MTASGTGPVFFLGSRAHYQVLEQPTSGDVENGNASTETIYTASVEQLWPSVHADAHVDDNCNGELAWNYNDQNDTVIYERTKPVGCVKRRSKRSSSEALLCEDEKPALLNRDFDKGDEKSKPSQRPSILTFLSSLARRKRRLETTQVYLQHLDSVLNTCSYRESCRCLDCQSRYFECAEESDEYSSDEDFTPYSQDVDSYGLPQLEDDDDEVFIDPKSDNTSTDLLLEDSSREEERTASEAQDEIETDKQLQMEVAASTSAMFNLLLYHPFSCSIQ
ncbi:uncharacterized protein LOC112052333 isoform X2 [Bicyclus anynana]|uniref:Uncharacterized protein LOC112052333 isoform X2 n=1 Tax=Bicyclus anynana TaxID=110368 RepID=A0A6J1NUT3_BICAN|nr:uncharacterized protein LOC112052333 isoform X2 [Bicyclus anynana]